MMIDIYIYIYINDCYNTLNDNNTWHSDKIRRSTRLLFKEDNLSREKKKMLSKQVGEMFLPFYFKIHEQFVSWIR